MVLHPLDRDFSVCKAAAPADIDLTKEFCFVGKTDGELSLVCLTQDAPKNALAREDGWKAFRVQGPLDFSLTGILAGIAAVLAENRIGLFALSTYETDYILVRAEQYAPALRALEQAGYEVR